MLTFDSRT
jgi:hypothetical protein